MSYQSFLHGSSKMLDDWVQILAIIWPLFCTFLCVTAELLFFVLLKSFNFFSFIELSSKIIFPRSLFLIHLTLQIILVFFYLIFPKFFLLILFLFKISQFWVPCLLKSLIVFEFPLFFRFSFVNLVLQRLLILLFQSFSFFLFFSCNFFFFELKLIDLFVQSFNFFILNFTKFVSLNLIQCFTFSDLPVDKFLSLLLCNILNCFLVFTIVLDP